MGIGAPQGEGSVWFGRKERRKNWRAGRWPPGREKEAQKGQKKLRHSARPTKLPLYTARLNSQPFCPEWSFLLGRHYSLRQGGPERRIYKRGADAVFFWGTHLTHVVFTFCPAVQFLWTRLSLERGGRILILFSCSSGNLRRRKKYEKGEWRCLWIGWFACYSCFAGLVGFAGLLGPTKSLPPPFVPTQATRNTQKQINTSELSYLRF